MHCEGRVAESPEFLEEGKALVVDLTQCAAPPDFIWKGLDGRVRLHIAGVAEDFYVGDVVRFRSSLRPPRDFQNRGSFKASVYYRSKGIDGLGFVGEPEWLVRLPRAEPAGFQHWIEKVRKNLREAVLFSNPDAAGGLILSLLIGEKDRLPESDIEAFRKTGVVHILSISGLHITLVALFFYFFRGGWRFAAVGPTSPK